MYSLPSQIKSKLADDSAFFFYARIKYANDVESVREKCKRERVVAIARQPSGQTPADVPRLQCPQSFSSPGLDLK